MISLNLRSPLFAAIAAARQMAAQGSGGAILNIVSIDAMFPAPTEGLYGAAKAALVNLTRVARHEVGKDRVRVNAIAPGVVETALTAPWLATEEQRLDQVLLLSDQPRRGPRRRGRRGRLPVLRRGRMGVGQRPLRNGRTAATSDVFRWVRAQNPVPEGSKI